MMTMFGPLQKLRIGPPSYKMKDILTIFIFWSIAVIFINPTGNFPLNDDWSYGLAVKRILQEGHFRPIGWTSMTLISHTIWGAFSSLIFGFSFTTLRLSTLFLGLVVGIATYILLINFNVRRWIAVATSLAILFNPVFFPLSYTFMTDVPFAAWMILSYLCFISYLKEEKVIDYIGGILFSLLAIFCRQVGLFIPLAFFVTVFFYRRYTFRRLFMAMLPLILGIALFFVFQLMLKKSGNMPALHDYQQKELVNLFHSQGLMLTIAKNVFVALLYLGLFLFPLFIIQWRTLLPKSFKQNIGYKIIFILFLIGGIFLVYTKREFMPIRGNILARQGVGPITLYDTYTLKLSHFSDIPFGITLLFTLISIVGGGLVLIQIISFVVDTIKSFSKRQQHEISMVKAFVFIGLLIYTAPILLHGFFDRYLIPAFILIAFYSALSTVHKQIKRTDSVIVFFKSITNCLL